MEDKRRVHITEGISLEDIIELTYEQAVSLLPDGDMIHTYLDILDILLGADWERKDILAAIKNGVPQIGGDQCRSHGFGLVVFIGEEILGFPGIEPLFIETKKGSVDKLEEEINA